MPSNKMPSASAQLALDLQIASNHEAIPDELDFSRWARATLQAADYNQPAELSIRIVEKEEIQILNQQYRQKDKPTNVLSFPADIPEEVDLPLLGDIVICAPIIAEEASAQDKHPTAHWAHMTIHGTLHLLGYDHIEDHEAEVMETLEIQILNHLHYPNPYEINDVNP